MKYKWFFCLILIACIALTAIGAASAQEVTVNGEKFNVPDSLQKDENCSGVMNYSGRTEVYVGYYNDTERTQKSFIL